VRTITRTGGGSTTFTFGAGPGSTSSSINLTASTTAAQVQSTLNSITALNGNVTVTAANAGGPFTVTFNNALANKAIATALTVNPPASATVATTTVGGAALPLTFVPNLSPTQNPAASPTAAQVKANLESIGPTAGLPALAGNVTV